MACHFCSSSEHLSENCDKYPTLDSRYSKLNYCFKPCLHQNSATHEHDSVVCVSSCSCKIFCDVCFQKHHISLCPKKDPKHPIFSNDFPETLNLLNLGYLFIKRFLALCNPIDKIKLQFSCKYLNHGYSEEKIKKLMRHENISLTEDVENYSVVFHRDILQLLLAGLPVEHKHIVSAVTQPLI